MDHSLLSCALAREELLRELCHRAGQQEQGHEVRNAHQSVEGVGDAPQQAQIDRRAQNGHEGVDHEEGADHLVGVEQELDAPGAVETPADDGGERKAAERHRRKDGRPAAVGGREAGDGQLCARRTAVAHRHAAAQDDHGGQGADDDGVSEDLEDAEHPLLDGLAGIGAGVGDGAGAEAGLIGEDAAGDALLHTEKDTADGTAGEGLRVECTADDGGQHRREAPVVDDHDAQCQHDVEQCHERHQLFGDAADALDAAQQHHGHHHSHHHAHDEVDRGQDAVQAAAVGQQGRVDGCDDGVDLGGVAGAEDRQHAEQRVQHREELPPAAEAVFNIVHGAAHQLAVFVPLAEMHGQRHFGEFGTHAQQSRAPHPEHRTRPADGDRARHTGDVAGADGSGQRRTHCLERSHRAVGGILFAEDAANDRFDGIGEFPELQKACPHTEQQAHADDADHRRDAPDKAVDRLIDGRDGFEHTFTPFFFTLTQRKLFYRILSGLSIYFEREICASRLKVC